MIWQQKVPTIEALQILAVGQAVALVPGSRIATPPEGEHWCIEWDIVRDGVTIPCQVFGRFADFMAADGDLWNRVRKDDFLAQWEPPPITLRAPDLRSSDLRG